MTDDGRRDAVVHGWILAEAPGHAPNRLRDSIRDQVADTRQERIVLAIRMDRLRTLGWVAAVVGLLVVVLVLGGLIGGPEPVVSPTPPPTPSSPGPSVQPTPRGVVLPAGEFASGQFSPAVVLTLPDGWTLEDNQPNSMTFVRPNAGYLVQGDNGLVGFDAIKLYARPIAGQPDGTIGGVEGVGTTARELAAWLSQRPQLTATAVTENTLAGLKAYVLDFQLSPAAGAFCGIPCANLLDDGTGQEQYAFGIEGDWRVRAYLLDTPDGSTVMVTVEDTDGLGFEDEIAAAEPILASLRFVEPSETSSPGPLPS
jgi:hypothetical protein